MAQAKDIVLRKKIVTDWQTGVSYAELSRRYGVHYDTVRVLCLRYEAQGESSLLPDYSQCGRRPKPEYEKSFRLVRLTKHIHQEWGIPYIITRIKEHYPDLPLQSIRHYQRKICRGKGKVPKAILPKPAPPDRPRKPHDEWEIDAKERIVLASGQDACFLNITDAKSSAALEAKIFPPRKDQPGATRTNSGTTA